MPSRNIPLLIIDKIHCTKIWFEKWCEEILTLKITWWKIFHIKLLFCGRLYCINSSLADSTNINLSINGVDLTIFIFLSNFLAFLAHNFFPSPRQKSLEILVFTAISQFVIFFKSIWVLYDQLVRNNFTIAVRKFHY